MSKFMINLYGTLFTLQGKVGDHFAGRKDRGATAVEYGLLVGLIAVVVIVGVTALGKNLDGLFTSVATTVKGVG